MIEIGLPIGVALGLVGAFVGDPIGAYFAVDLALVGAAFFCVFALV